MDPLLLGSLVLNRALLYGLISVLAASGVLKLHLRRHDPMRPFEIDHLLLNATMMAFFAWKFSYVLFHPADTLQQPMLLLYFDGGTRGGWLAAAIAAIYMFRIVRKKSIP